MLQKQQLLIILSSAAFIIILTGSFVLFRSAPLPPSPEVFQHEVAVSTGTVSSGDSLYTILTENGFSSEEILSFQNTMKEVYDPRKFKPGDTYEIVRSTSGVFSCFRYYPSVLKFHVVEKNKDGGYNAYSREHSLEKRIVGLKVEIKTSLWDAIIDSGTNPELTMRLADIFSWQIDFLTELRAGDIFRFIWEQHENGGKKVLDGHILAAQYDGVEGQKHTAVFFESYDAKQGYYTLKGESLRSDFLKAPLNYRRISSHFSHNRYHPILRYSRPHLGIDYAAPMGTPIVSVADGTVTHAAWKGQNGNLVVVRHNSVYTTTYGHLSKYGKGVKKGKHVNQGQVIGYVGMTGLATGPHLDFRIKKHDQFVNFLQLKFAPTGKIENEDTEKFETLKKERLSQLITLCDQGLELSSLSRK
ncbi:MAG: M23 family metallopeptidase [bacterium]